MSRIKPQPVQKDQNQPSKKPDYRVENWQIPVPIGDASAHFLLDISGSSKRVINAFFMDGGDDSGGDKASKQITRALEAIDDAYGTDWKFDAIVCTHHDSDHYRGLEELLEDNTKRQRESSLQEMPFRKLYFQQTVTFYSGGSEGDNFRWWPSKCHKGIKDIIIKGEYGIGIDMFSRTRMFNMPEPGHADESLDKACGVTWHEDVQNQDLRRPRFCIVGANGYSVYEHSTIQFMTAPTRNQTSILAVLYWPGNNGHTSYFTGGDGNPKVEIEGVIPWMEEWEDKTDDLPKLPVDVIKLDHHGSLGEMIGDASIKAGKTILNNMEPLDIIVTPGTMHGHPNWAVMRLVHKYFESQRADGQDTTGKLHTTRSPYWMSKNRVSGLDVNANHAKIEKLKAIWVTDAKEMSEELSLEELMAGEIIFYPDHDEELKEAFAETKTEHGLKTGKQTSALLRKKEKQMKILMSESLRDPNKPQPVPTPHQIAQLQVDEDRKQIVDLARKHWPTICDQGICDLGDPYWLIRFAFGDNGKTMDMGEIMNADGYKENAVPVDIADLNIKVVSTQDSEGREIITHHVSGAKGKPIQHLDTAEVATPLGYLKHLIEEIKTTNVRILTQFTNTYEIETVEKKIRPPKVKIANFSGWKVRRGKVRLAETSDDDLLESILDFDKFVKRYSGAKRGQKLTDKEIDEMKGEWRELVDNQLQTSVAQHKFVKYGFATNAGDKGSLWSHVLNLSSANLGSRRADDKDDEDDVDDDEDDDVDDDEPEPPKGRKKEKKKLHTSPAPDASGNRGRR